MQASPKGILGLNGTEACGRKMGWKVGVWVKSTVAGDRLLPAVLRYAKVSSESASNQKNVSRNSTMCSMHPHDLVAIVFCIDIFGHLVEECYHLAGYCIRMVEFLLLSDSMESKVVSDVRISFGGCTAILIGYAVWLASAAEVMSQRASIFRGNGSWPGVSAAWCPGTAGL